MVAVPSKVSRGLSRTLTIAARHVLNNVPSGTAVQTSQPPPFVPPPDVAMNASDPDATKVFAWLDATYALPRIATNSVLFAKHLPDGIAEYAFRLWASAHHLNITETVSRLTEGRLRVLTIWQNYSIVASLQFEPVPWVN